MSGHIHRLPRKVALLDEGVDVLAELRQPAAAAQRGQVQQRHHQALREILEALLRPALALHRFQVSKARSTRQSAAPHQTVAQDGPLEELTEEEEEEETQINDEQTVQLVLVLLGLTLKRPGGGDEQ